MCDTSFSNRVTSLILAVRNFLPSNQGQPRFSRNLSLISSGFAPLLLLCLATAAAKAQTPRINVALAANGAQATASSEYSGLYPAASVNNGDRRGLNWGNGGGWNCATANAYPDWVQIEFTGDKTIDEIDVFTLQDTYAAPAEPTEVMTFTLYGATEWQVQYWNGVDWTTVPNGNVTNNDRVWRRFSFSAVTTTKIRVLVSAALFYHSRIVEVEAWSDAVLSSPANNVALAANGGIASASSTFSTAYPIAAINNGDRAGLNWGNGGGWNCATADAYPDSVQVEFNGSKTIEEIDVFTLQDGIGSPTYPTQEMTFTLYGITRFDVQYWDGSSWINVPNGSVSNNNKVWRRFNFSAITTSKIRVVVHDALFHNSRIVEVEAWAPPPASPNARLDPRNRTGGVGEDPLSRNFNWSLPLLSLPGRAGMDLGLTLSYNSLVWTKTGSFISFDDDHGFPSAGFRLGFPVIQSLYYNPEVGKYAYLLIGSDGSRTELRQVGTSGLFESADSGHLLLDTTLTLPAPDNGKFVLRTTDGTRMWYELIGGDYQCTRIKDRNGNFITINYLNAKIDTIIDTLNRQIKFEYDANGLLEKITQVWKQETPNQRTQTWASFVYTDVPFQTAFTDLTVVGPENDSSRKLLSKVTLADNSPTPSNNSRFEFTYTSWGQIRKVSHIAADNRVLNYRSYNLPQTNSPAQPDCPRFTERRDWAENWNRSGTAATGYMLPTGLEQEVVTTFAVPNINENDSWTMPDGTPKTGTRTQVTVADGTPEKVTNEIYFIGQKGSQTTGWRRGLPALIKTYDSNGALQRQVMTTWIQDNEAVAYMLNPRVEETNTYDEPPNNRKRVRIAYASIDLGNGMSCKLPEDIFEYQANASTVLRRTHTTYHPDPDSVYKTRRILGLPIVKTLYEVKPDLSEKLMSKFDFTYDGNAIEGAADPTATQHDNAKFGVSFVIGRGNLTSVRRYDVDHPDNVTIATTTTNKYNRTGSVVSAIDAMGHEVKFFYTDEFATNAGPTDHNPLDAERPFTTLAYPTKVDDPDGYSTRIRYNYDFGARTWQQTPQPNTTANTPGPEQTFTFDAIGRLIRTTSLTNKAFTRYNYGPNYVETFSSINSIVETNNEGRTLKVFDGLGRVIATATDHPASGTIDRFGAVLILYDQMGRVRKRSNPTETNISITGSPINATQFVPLGDDALPNGGWHYVQQTYDWKGRPLVTTNQDGTTKTAEYTGCGCAGGEVVTLTDEGTIDGGIAKRRQQMLYSDVLGRVVKTEVLNWQGGTPYSTTVNTYNARDQIMQTKQYAGLEGSGIFQETTLTYDGFGRLSTKHMPEQNAGTSTVYTYNADDTVLSVTDARGASVTYGYNNRHLVTGVTYNAPAGIEQASNVTFIYDAAGNRTSMQDGMGSQSYTYNQLSQLLSETRILTNVGTFTLTYDYNLAGELKKITDASNTTINYAYDLAGRLTGVTGSDTLVGGVSTYASGFEYRAWGALKQVTIGTHTASFGYNSRVQPTNFNVNNGGVVNQNYEYYSDGRLSFVHNTTDNNFDRALRYDHAGRLKRAKAGTAAHDDDADFGSFPMDETFEYDAFDNTTARETVTWLDGYTDFASYTNRRRSNWQYDAAGRVTTIDTRTYTYDAAGQNTVLTGQRWRPTGYVATRTESGFDGDGNRIRENSGTSSSMILTYYLRSSVLGGAIVEELNNSGQKQIGYVYTPSGSVLATQFVASNFVNLKQLSPIGASQYEFNTAVGSISRREFDPVDAAVRLNPNSPGGHPGDPGDIPEGGGGGSIGGRSSAIENPAAGCMLDGIFMPCSIALRGRNSSDVVYVDPLAKSYPSGRGRTGRTRPVWVVEDTSFAIRTGDNQLTIYSGPGGHYDWIEDPNDVLEVFTQQRFHNPQNTVTAPIGDLEGNLQKILAQRTALGTCEEYTTTLLAQAAKMFAGNYPHINTIMEGYEKITGPKGGGYILKQHPYDTVDGDLFANGARPGQVWLVPNRQYGSSMSAQRIAEFQDDYAWTALHETFHLGKQGGYDDEHMAAAAYALAGLTLPTTSLTGLDRAYFYTANFDNELMKHCPKLK